MDTPATSSTPREPLEMVFGSLPFLVPTIVVLLSRMGATDLAYHLRAGAEVLSGHIPRVDTYTFTVPGTPWLNQQWGAQGILEAIYRAGGWPLLQATQALLVGTAFFLIYLATHAAGARCRTASLLTLGGFVVAAPELGMRPQLLALPLFAALLLVTVGRSAHPGRLWLAPVLAAVTANVHGSFALFPVIVGLAWLDDVRTNSPQTRRTLLVTCVTAAATLLNPYGLRAWAYTYELSSNPVIRQTISEWAPTTISTIPGWFTIGSALAVVVYLVRRTQPTPWTALLTLGLFFLLALSAQRAIVWWGMVTPVVLGALLRPAEDPSSSRVEVADSRHQVTSPIPAYAMTAVLVTAVIALAPWWRGSSYDKFLNAAPPGLTQAARTDLTPGTRTLVHQPWGSWFEFALPDIPVFVDSRIEIVPEDIWQDYGQVGFSGAEWKAVLDRWQVQAIVADADWDLLPILQADPGWRMAYEDSDGALFVRA